MSTTATTTPQHHQPHGAPARPLNWGQGIIGLVLGYLVAHLLVRAFQAWAGVPGDAMLSLSESVSGRGAVLIGLVGAIPGFFVGLRGWRAALGRNLTGAMFWSSVGFMAATAATMLVRMAFGLDAWSTLPVVVFASIGGYLGFAVGIGGMGPWFRFLAGRDVDLAGDHSQHGAPTWKAYFGFNTDHKVIGVQYIVVNFIAMVMGGIFALAMRAELAQPGLQYMDGSQYNAAFTAHGALMLFFWIIPIFAGIGNYIIPLMLGAADMAFPRLNGLSFWTLIFGLITAFAALMVGGFEAGWTAYAPLATQAEISLEQLLFSLTIQFVGASSIMTAINFIVTIVGMRAPGLRMWRLPLFVWANLTTSVLVVLGTPFIGGAQLMVLLDLVMDTALFNPILGGDVVAYQHVFWFYSHPAVYIMVLPGFGIITDVITTHARKQIFGYKAVAISTMAIGFLGFAVWAHHMFTSGMPDWFRLPMMVLTMLIAVPTGIKVLSWAATLWMGKLHLRTPMLFALGFLYMFTMGGVTGVMVAVVPIDIQVHDSYFVVAHFHYVLFGGSTMAALAGIYHWFPKITGRMYDERLGKLHFWGMFITQNVIFFPMHWTGVQGMVRRYADHGEEFSTINMIMSVGAFAMAIVTLVFFYNMARSWRYGPTAGPNPWKSHTLEWQVSSPPPLFNFYDTPRVLDHPYPFGEPDRVHGVVAEKGKKTADHPLLATAAQPEAATTDTSS